MLTKAIVNIASLLLTFGAFILLCISFATDQWRGNPHFVPILPPGLPLPPPVDINHGLWYSCMSPGLSCDSTVNKPPDSPETRKLKAFIRMTFPGTPEEKDSDLRGGLTIGLLGGSMLFGFIVLILSLINICSNNERWNRLLLIVVITAQLIACAFASAAMINFTKYFKLLNTPLVPWSEYRYSYWLGWVGLGLMFLSLFTSILETILKSKHPTVFFKYETNQVIIT